MSLTATHFWFGTAGVLCLIDDMLRYKMLQHRFPRKRPTLLELLGLPRSGGFTFMTDPTDFDLTGRVYRRWAIRIQLLLWVWIAFGIMMLLIISQKP